MNRFAVVPMSFFDTVGGLPTHPLVVHLAVVMLPLATLALMSIIIVPAWRASHGWLTMAGLTVGAGGAFLAAQTGETLAQQVGLPQDHAKWGDLLEKAALGLFVVAVIWFVLQRRDAARTPGTARRVLGPPAQATAAVLSIILAVGVLALTVVVRRADEPPEWSGSAQAELLQGPTLSEAIGPYSSRAIRSHLRRRGITEAIPEPDDQKRHRERRGSAGGRPPLLDASTYKGRNVIERGFCDPQKRRGLATRGYVPVSGAVSRF